jgi:cellulose synthase/poly-beta-1,6-N-acetylglucosamine synthase-like glycosyltransferase
LKSLRIVKNNERETESILTEINFKMANKPHITVVIPIHNETNKVFNAIYSVLNQTYKNFDLILVDDGSTNTTFESIVKQFKLKRLSKINDDLIFGTNNNVKLSLIMKQASGKSDSLNFASKYAKGEYILFLDADTILIDNALSYFIHYILHSPREPHIFGSIIGVNNNYNIERGSINSRKQASNILTVTQEIEYLNSIFLQRLALTKLKSNLIISGATLLIKTSTFKALGGFDKSSISEDLDLCLKTIKHAKAQSWPYPVEYIPRELSYTEVPYTIKHFIYQRSRWFLGLVKSLFKYKDDFLKGRLGLAPIFTALYFICFSIPNALIYLGINIYILNSLSFQHIIWVNFAIMMSNSIYSLFCLAIYQHYRGYNLSFFQIIINIFHTLCFPFVLIPLDRLSHLFSFYRLLTNSIKWGHKTRETL